MTAVELELPEGPVTIMFTDVEGSTALRTSLGDAAADNLFKQHDEIVRAQIEAHRGHDLQAALGDGFLAIFVSTKRAIACAVAIQQDLERFNRERPGAAIRVRIGLNTGEVAWQNGQPSGEAIHAASRVCASASGGEVFVSDVTRQLAGTIPDVTFADRGDFDLKGFPQPWKLWSLSWRPAAPDVSQEVFVGRDAELNELRKRLRDAIDGRGSLVLIGGEPGVGKTTLVRQLIKEAEQAGAVALFGRCYESSGTVPYSPFVETTEQALQLVPAEWVREDLGDDAAEVARMVPELRRRFPDIAEPLDLPPEQQRRYFFNAISSFITRGTQRVPLVLIADDAHWADEPTLLLLEHVAGLLPSLRMLAIGTYRDVELDVSRPLAATLERLTRSRLATRISLKRFDRASVASLLEAHSGRTPPEALVEVIFSETEGNAFFVDEVFRHLVEEGKIFDAEGEFLDVIDVDELDVPESVRLVVGRRIERLGETAQRVLAAGAVVGRGFEFSLLESIADVPVDTLLDVVEEAERARVIIPEDRGGRVFYSFAHELIRQTLLASLSLPRRQRLHLAVATALEEGDPAIAETRPSEIANHLLQAGTAADQGKALQYLLRSAKRALDAAAFEEAMWATESALSLVQWANEKEHLDVLEQRGWAERGLGHFDRCIEVWKQVAEGRARLGEAERAGELLWECGYQLVWLARFEEAFTTYGRAMEFLGPDESGTKSTVLGGMGTLLGFAGLYEQSEEMFAEAVAMAEKVGDKRSLALAHWGHGVSLWTNARVEESGEAEEKSVQLAREVGDLWTLVDALAWRAFPLVMQGKTEQARRVALEGIDLGVKLGHQGGEILARRGLEMANFMDGLTAPDLLAFAHEDSRRMAAINSPWEAQGHAWLAFAHTQLADLDAGRRAALKAIELEPQSAWTGVGAGVLFLNRALAGDEQECRRVLDEVLPPMPDSYDAMTAGTTVSLLCAAEGCALLGWTDESEPLVEPVSELAQHALVRIFDGASLHRILGMMATAAQRWDDAESHFRAALAETESFKQDLGQIHHRYAEMLLRRGRAADVERAREFLRIAIDDYTRREIALFAAQAEALAATI